MPPDMPFHGSVKRKEGKPQLCPVCGNEMYWITARTPFIFAVSQDFAHRMRRIYKGELQGTEQKPIKLGFVHPVVPPIPDGEKYVRAWLCSVFQCSTIVLSPAEMFAINDGEKIEFLEPTEDESDGS